MAACDFVPTQRSGAVRDLFDDIFDSVISFPKRMGIEHIGPMHMHASAVIALRSERIPLVGPSERGCTSCRLRGGGYESLTDDEKREIRRSVYGFLRVYGIAGTLLHLGLVYSADTGSVEIGEAAPPSPVARIWKIHAWIVVAFQVSLWRKVSTIKSTFFTVPTPFYTDSLLWSGIKVWGPVRSSASTPTHRTLKATAQQ